MTNVCTCTFEDILLNNFDRRVHIIILSPEEEQTNDDDATIKLHWPMYSLISGNAVPSLGPL